MAVLTHSAAQHGAAFDRIQTRIDAMRARLARYRLYRQTLNELSALSNSELADLGLNRSGLRSAAYQTAYEVR